ncbi:hypothetical protein KBC25_03525 [Candidatus Pacearchaeota archaeon]|jgi:hypothetical protein|nr:hypothetical protein [Candidatus Pacearchaeota archaeon]
MKISIKVRFNSTYPKFEKVMPGKYILYIPEPQTDESEKFIKGLLSNKLGVRRENISLINIEKDGKWNFHIGE